MSITKVNGANRKWTGNRGCSRRGLFESGSTRSPSSRIHRNGLGSNWFARIGVFPLWTNRGSLTGRCSRSGRSAPVTSGPGWPTTLHATHTARPLSRNKNSRRASSSSQSPIHLDVYPRRNSRIPQQILTTNNTSSNCQMKEIRRNARNTRHSSGQLNTSSLAGNPERQFFAREVSHKNRNRKAVFSNLSTTIPFRQSRCLLQSCCARCCCKLLLVELIVSLARDVHPSCRLHPSTLGGATGEANAATDRPCTVTNVMSRTEPKAEKVTWRSNSLAWRATISKKATMCAATHHAAADITAAVTTAHKPERIEG